MNFRKYINSKLYNNKPFSYSLDEILDFATLNVEYYKQFRGLKLNQFPILTKDILRLNYEKLISNDIEYRNSYINTSGGSTGEPAKFIQDKNYLLVSRFYRKQMFQWANYEYGEPKIKLWGSERDILIGGIGIKAKIFNYFKNTIFLNSFSMSEDTMDNYVNIINKHKPKLLYGYVQSIYELAKYIKKNDKKIVKIQSVISTAGTLYPFMEELFKDVFNCNVFNSYGGREVGIIASTYKENSGLRIFDDKLLVEILDENNLPCPDGVEGNIVITLFVNLSMPLIRYKIGDRGILNKTKYSYPILEKISGRNVDIFKTKDGKLIDGEYFTHLLYYKSWINKFQIIQKNYNFIVIKIIQNDIENKNDLINIKKDIKKIMGNDCQIKFDFVKEIKPLKSGKYIYTISELK